MNCRIEIIYSQKEKLSEKILQFIFELNQKNIPALGSLKDLKHVRVIYNHSLFAALVIVKEKIVGFAFVMDYKSDYKSLNYKYFKNNFKNFLYIDRVALAVDFQRKGCGTELYNEIYKIANKYKLKIKMPSTILVKFQPSIIYLLVDEQSFHIIPLQHIYKASLNH